MTLPASVHRLLIVARHEASTQMRSPMLFGLFAFAAIATVAINPAAMIPSGDAAIGGVRPFSNSRYALAQTFALTGLLFYTFLTSILAGLAVVRDDEERVGDLIHSTPLTPQEYVLGKFGGIVAVLGLVVTAHLTLAIVWYEGALWWGSDAILGPFGLANYLIPAMIFLVPGIVFCAALAFAAGERTRAPLAVYAVSTALFFGALGGLIPRPSSSLDGALDLFFQTFDLWGARWLSQTIFHADRGVEFYNQAPFAFDWAFLLNRLFVAGVPALAIGISMRHARNRIRGRGRASSRGPGVPREPAVAESSAVAVRRASLRMRSRPPGVLAGAIGVARADLLRMKGEAGPWLFVGFAMLLTLESLGSARGVFDSQVILTAGGAAVGLIEVVTAMGCLLLMFHIGESLDSARHHRLQALIGATPVRSSSLLMGTQLSGAALVSGLLGSCGLIVLALLTWQGQAPVDVRPLALVWGLLLMPTFLVWSAWITAVVAITRSRHAAYVAGLGLLMLTIALTLSGSMTWLTNWPLWGVLRWSDLGMFEPDRAALLLNRLTMIGLTGLLGTIALAAWPRTEADRLRGRGPARLRAQLKRLTPAALTAVIPALCLSSSIQAGPDGKAAREEDRNYWRRNVATWSGFVPPALIRVEAWVDLHPRESRMDVRGVFLLRNTADHEVRVLPFTVGPGFGPVTWEIDGLPARALNRSGLHILSLVKPLTPGGQTRIAFAYTARLPYGTSRGGAHTSEFILPSGVVLSTLDRNFLPLPGFMEDVGVNDDNRAEPFEIPEDAWKGTLPPLSGGTPFTSLMQVTAPSEYTVNGAGEKLSQSVSDGRTTVVWESAHPVRFLNLVAGRFAVKRKGGAAVFHHPAHGYNVDEILEALAAARARYSEWFRRYPWTELRLSEYADHSTRAQGFPTNISFSEGIGFLTQSGGGVSLPTIVTAHEAAHQWWAHLLMPGRAPGADVLIEGMAHYSTMLFLEAEHGDEARREFARGLELRYTNQRRLDGEKPLSRIVSGTSPAEESAIYDKGAWVMWMLQQQLGRDNMLAGLRSFIRRFEGSADHPALQDLVEELRPLAPSASDFQSFVDEWFQGTVMPKFRFSGAQVTRTVEGWTVTADLENIGSGTVTLDVVAARGERSSFGGPPPTTPYEDARVKVRLKPGQKAAISLKMSFKPDRLLADPDVLVLQLNRDRARLVLH